MQIQAGTNHQNLRITSYFELVRCIGAFHAMLIDHYARKILIIVR